MEELNSRSRSEHIECEAHIELRRQHIENPQERIYIDGAPANRQVRQQISIVYPK